MKLRSSGSNQTECPFNDGAKILFSYETPVAAYLPERGYIKTSKKWTATTTRHIDNWSPECAKSVPQQELSNLGEGIKR